VSDDGWNPDRSVLDEESEHKEPGLNLIDLPVDESGELTFEALVQIANLIVRKAVSTLDWSDYLDLLDILGLDEGDARAVIKLCGQVEARVPGR
jgi:hypothetical protein